MHDVGNIGDGQQSDLRAVKSATAGCCAGYGTGATRLGGLLIMRASRFVT